MTLFSLCVLFNGVSKKEICWGNDGLVEVGMFPKTDGQKPCRRNSVAQRCEVVTDSAETTSLHPPPASQPPLPEALCAFWLSCPTMQLRAVGTQLVASRTWWTSQLCSVGSMTKLNHIQESVLCQKLIFLEREEFMWFYQAACPSYVWLCAVACVSTETEDTFSCCLRVTVRKTNDASRFLGK